MKINFTYITFSISIFLGAFLLFQVQPIISKYILPWFGGSSAVWITAMLFFQIFLLFGYFYVFLLSLLSLKKQIIFHGIFLLIALFGVLLSLGSSQIPILPDIKYILSDNFTPIIQVLWILTFTVGLPYLILSTTSILLQKWFGITNPNKSPYLFYSLSNFASLFALLSYPFLVEPFFQLKTQGLVWSIAFIIYGLFLALCCIQLYFSTLKTKQNILKAKNTIKDIKKISRKTLFLWILLPAIASLMLLSSTNLLTQSVAPVPFLWLLPLSIYLISFIICFSGKWYFRNLYAYISLILGFFALAFMFGNIPSLIIGVTVYSLMLFSACMLCHGELYALRPAPNHLDSYYLFIAIGSAVSGIIVGIIAPLFFKGIWETYIGFYLTFLLTIWILVHYKNSFFYNRLKFFANSDKEAYVFALIAYPTTVIITSLALNILSGDNPLKQKIWRNFYGILSIKHKSIKNNNLTTLSHGNILHGSQFSGKLQHEPTSYYGKKSGIGLAILNHPKYGKNLRMGIIGLGAGTLASYGTKGDTITFYEINPTVVEIANTQFTYLKNSKAKIHTAIGDGRLSLQNEGDGKKKYDFLILDAFSDDSIPLHLFTKEAFSLYLKKINFPEGIIAIHISNQYIDLKPVLYQVAQNYRLRYAFIHTQGSFPDMASEWALLSFDKKFFDIPAIAHAKYPDNKKYKKISLWTDNYSNLFQVLK